ncbi:hypothetical protein B0H16DRAFT_1607442 [Mycena metata]|uniref:BTB domain-containing protein n=1 Tax=Mycena metata TaxID=1033252 RepID=A0AAD7HF53_9AGAR|nr:hypothetical protein B0H16DRAFT_1607442 [Mycena metata]
MDIDTNQPPPTNNGVLTRAEGLWFEDCGLIIQAEKTLFRVSRDFLAFHSPVFKDMLALPTPKDAVLMDGCPFVMLPDTAEDITVFLKALIHYDFFEPYPAPTTLAILTGVLRMSHKYEVDALRKRGLAHISAAHPTTLSGYQALSCESPDWLANREPLGSSPTIITLARQLSIDWILPAAFYRLCERAIGNEVAHDSMDQQDQVNFMGGCRFLEGTGVSEVLEFLWPRAVLGCTSPELCSTSRSMTRRMAEEWRRRGRTFQALMPIEIWEDDNWDELSVCDPCLASMKREHQKALEAMWDSLPETFGLPAWAELEKTKRDALY